MNKDDVLEMENPVGLATDSKGYHKNEHDVRAWEERRRKQVIIYDMYHVGGMRNEAIAAELGMPYGVVLDLLRAEEFRQKRIDTLIKNSLFTPPKEKAKVQRGFVTPIQSSEIPQPERGRFLDTEEGQDTLERYNRPYEAVKPEFLKFRSPPENPLLTYGGEG